MGLLDMFGTSMDDPRTAATLQLAQGLLSSPRVMQGLAGGLSGYQQAMAQAKQAKMMEEMRSMQMAQQRMQMEAIQRQQAKEQGIEAAYRNAFRTPEQMAMAQNGGPTVAAAQAAPKMQAGFDPMALRSELAKVDPVTAYQLFQPKAPDFKVVGNSLVQIGPDGVKEAYKAPDKNDLPSAVREYEYAKGQGYGGTFQQFQLEQKRAGATSVNVMQDNLGLKPKDRFEMEGKLADDFKGVTKLDSAVLGSTRKIATALSQPGAIKDQAAIYSFAKMLDPDGAVREADYAAIANTAGALDRVRNYATRLLTGEQLTPAQRDEMLNMARAFEQVSQKRIDAAKKSYAEQAQRYNLRPEAVYGASDGGDSSAAKKPAVVRTGTHNGRKVVQYADGTVAYAD